jgi:hypothetical protein
MKQSKLEFDYNRYILKNNRKYRLFSERKQKNTNDFKKY